MFQHAIVRKPGRNFAEGITSSQLGAPVYEEALRQHDAYCTALEACGLKLTVLPADEHHPDSTFVEDVAVVTGRIAVLTRPGAESRAEEVEGLSQTLAEFFPTLHEITAPGTLDGGDVCQAENHFFIGISHRTNEEGGRRLAEFLARAGYASSFLDIREMKALLHLKSGVAYIGNSNLVVSEELADHLQFRQFNLIRVDAREGYASNCLRINERVLVPAGFPRLENSLGSLGYNLLRLEMSEFQKMDGGLSCLSLRF